MKLSTRLLIKVSDRCEIAGSCIYPLPIVPDALIKPELAEPLKPGDKLELRRPDGSVAYVILQALQRPLSENAGLFIELGPSVTIDDLPIGTEIWKVGRLPVRLQAKSFEVRG
jgi:hypothetical protein